MQFRTSSNCPFPYCFDLELKPREKGEQWIEVHGRINFGPGRHTLTRERYYVLREDWKFTFVVKSAELELKLIGLRSPEDRRGYVDNFPLSDTMEWADSYEEINGKQKENSRTASGEGAFGSSPLSIFGSMEKLRAALAWFQKEGASQSQKQSISEKQPQKRAYRIHTVGPEDNPIWYFSAESRQGYLGSTLKGWLADMIISDRSLSINAVLSASAACIDILDIDSREYALRPDAIKAAIKAKVRRILLEEAKKHGCLASFSIYSA